MMLRTLHTNIANHHGHTNTKATGILCAARDHGSVIPVHRTNKHTFRQVRRAKAQSYPFQPFQSAQRHIVTDYCTHIFYARI